MDKEMEIEVKLFATLRDYLPKGSGQFSCTVAVNSTDTVRDVLKKLKIPDEIPKIILVNGVHSNLDRVLKYGDVLSVFPPVAGG
ncbi:MAG: MoaD/ThiS family protein [Deltaproteobacteria bacterium]|nr:MoaD/ThiS family protein [Deltaproteobacteria bacterium]